MFAAIRVIIEDVKALVVTGGRGPNRADVQPWASNAELICACDSGYELAGRLGLEPDLLVGDMDSIENRSVLASLPAERVEVHPQEKDETDTEIGVRTAKEHGATSIVIVGGGGGRLDHLLGILSIFHRDPTVAAWLTHGNEAIQVADDLEQYELVGQTVSFFPLGTHTCRMTSSGLKWPLDELQWHIGDVGISNVVVGSPLRVSMRSGRLLMVRPLDQRQM